MFNYYESQLRHLIDTLKWGEITVTIRNGKVTLITKSETIKVD